MDPEHRKGFKRELARPCSDQSYRRCGYPYQKSMATWKRKGVYNFEARQLLVPIFKDGKRVYDSPSLEEIKAYCAQQVDTLWDEVKRFDYPHRYYVDLSDKLYHIKSSLLEEMSMKALDEQ